MCGKSAAKLYHTGLWGIYWLCLEQLGITYLETKMHGQIIWMAEVSSFDYARQLTTHVSRLSRVNTLRPRQNGRRLPDDIFKCIFLKENWWISIKISLKFVPMVPINNIAALVQIMAWRRPGDKPLSEPMMVCFLTHICVTRPQWVKVWCLYKFGLPVRWVTASLVATITFSCDIMIYILSVFYHQFPNIRKAMYTK